jgi:hypothetical protein
MLKTSGSGGHLRVVAADLPHDYQWLGRIAVQRALRKATLDANVGVVTFKGTLKPGTGNAHIGNYFRFCCGKIVESWDKFEIFNVVSVNRQQPR